MERSLEIALWVKVMAETFACGACVALNNPAPCVRRQMTYREKPCATLKPACARDPSKLYGMGLRGAVAKNRRWPTPNEMPPTWRIVVRPPRRLIPPRAQTFSDRRTSGLSSPNNCVRARTSTTIDLCLSLFSGADFRSTKRRSKMHQRFSICEGRSLVLSMFPWKNGRRPRAAGHDRAGKPDRSMSWMRLCRFQTAECVSIGRCVSFVTRAKRNRIITASYSRAVR